MEGTEDFEKVQSILDKMKVYMEEEIRDKQELKYLLPKCKNRHSECAFWAFSGSYNIQFSLILFVVTFLNIIISSQIE